MPRSRRVQLLALALFLLGVSAVPGWEVAHTAEHSRLQLEIGAHASGPLQGHPDDARLTYPDADHQHLDFATPIRPSGGSNSVWATLPSARVSIVLSARLVPSAPFLNAEARAGPSPARSSQPRAPPLL